MTLRVDGWLADRLARFGIEAGAEGRRDEGDGRITLRGSCESFDDARARVLALGGAVEVIEPEPLRRSVIDYAEQIAKRYAIGC
jgi:hypothetical protein